MALQRCPATRHAGLAAFYLSRILVKPIAFHADPAARDREIETLRNALLDRK
jgi:hypothetical protein